VVGIRKPSIHHHFPSKADLVTTLVARYREAAEEGIVNLEHAPFQVRSTSCVRTSATGSLHRRCQRALLRVRPAGQRVAGSAGRSRPAGPRLFPLPVGMADPVLERGVHEGVITLTDTPRIEAEAFMATVHGAMLSARAYGDTSHFRQHHGSAAGTFVGLEIG
jgi:TetR/AcrR family transcriptional repressor of nem operon